MSSAIRCVAIILAGGAGTRLGELTAHHAKPAVSFGGRYRIIDFTLSNCVASGIHHVSVLTQYKPRSLHDYLNKHSSSQLTVHCLYAAKHIYKGTADAVFQNLSYIEAKKPTHVLVLSGDHIYQMNYQQLIHFHLKKQAGVTIGSVQVPIEDASRFGILSVDSDKRIHEFTEKPAIPHSTTASMGIYLFDWQLLKESLRADSELADSTHDFGKDLIPSLLLEKRNMFAFPYQNYWRDVGTVQSYWQAQMDWVNSSVSFNSSYPHWMRSTNHYSSAISVPIHRASSHSSILHSVVSPSVLVREGSVIEQSVILPGSSIGKHSHLKNVIVAENTHIPNHFSFQAKEDATLITQSMIDTYTKSYSSHTS